MRCRSRNPSEAQGDRRAVGSREARFEDLPRIPERLPYQCSRGVEDVAPCKIRAIFYFALTAMSKQGGNSLFGQGNTFLLQFDKQYVDNG